MACRNKHTHRKMKFMEEENTFENCIHHMGVACLMNDTAYLENEINSLRTMVDMDSLDAKQMEHLRNVSLEASMEGHVKCLECLVRRGIPLDALCPVIAGCHGHRTVIEFCAKNGMDCAEAWGKYFGWIMTCSVETPSQPNETLILASEWVREYKRNVVVV